MKVLISLIFAASKRMDVGATDCLCPVTANIDLVCGSNGVTYTNPSSLRCAVKCTKNKIDLAHHGECGGNHTYPD